MSADTLKHGALKDDKSMLTFLQSSASMQFTDSWQNLVIVYQVKSQKLLLSFSAQFYSILFRILTNIYKKDDSSIKQALLQKT